MNNSFRNFVEAGVKMIKKTLIFMTIALLLPKRILAHGSNVNDSDNLFEHYNWLELWNPFFLAFLSVVLYFYSKAIKKNEVSNIGKIGFILGILLVYASLGTPLHILGDQYLFSAHMLEQSIIYIMVPPLLLKGLPTGWIKQKVHQSAKIKGLSFFFKPLVSLLLFNVLFSFYHIPLVFNFVIEDTFFHNFTHIVLTIAAFLMWLPLVHPTKENDMSYLKQIGYIFGAGILLTPACALIIFSDVTLYPHFQGGMNIPISVIEDQRLGGIIMKVIQEIVYGSAIGFIFYKWAKIEKDTVDPLPVVAK